MQTQGQTDSIQGGRSRLLQQMVTDSRQEERAGENPHRGLVNLLEGKVL